MARITFSGDEHRMGRKQLARFVLMWLATTAVSTWSMGSIDDGSACNGPGWRSLAVELVLGVLGFLLSRHWVYKH